MADHVSDIIELKRLRKIAELERDFLQDRLDAIRANKEKLVSLLDMPTPEEGLKPGGYLTAIFEGPRTSSAGPR